MYTWFIDYVYLGFVTVFVLSAPIYIYFLEKKPTRLFYKAKIMTSIFAMTCIVLVAFHWLKEIHIDFISEICFEGDSMTYRKGHIPEGCHNFNISKYMGIGWPLTTMFWVALDFIYLMIIYIGWVLRGRAQSRTYDDHRHP